MRSSIIFPWHRNLYWAFSIVAGAWLIALAVSLVLVLIQHKVNNSSKADVTNNVQFSQFLSDSDFRNYVQDNEEADDKVVPPELSPKLNENITPMSFFYNDLVLIKSNSTLRMKSLKNPREVKWEKELTIGTKLISVKFFNQKIVLAVSTNIDSQSACPLPILEQTNLSTLVECNRVYHPRDYQIPSDQIISLLVLNVDTGQQENMLSYVGSTQYLQWFMTDTDAFLAYMIPPNDEQIKAKFLVESENSPGSELLKQQLKWTLNLPISTKAKAIEIDHLVENLTSQMNDTQRNRFQLNFEQKLSDYKRDRGEELTTTLLIKVSLEQMTPTASTIAKLDLSPEKFMLLSNSQLLLLAKNTTGLKLNKFTENQFSPIAELDMDNTNRVANLQATGKWAIISFFKDTEPELFINSTVTPMTSKKNNHTFGFGSKFFSLGEDRLLAISRQDNKIGISIIDLTSNATTVTDVLTLPFYWSEYVDADLELKSVDNAVVALAVDNNLVIVTIDHSQIKMGKTIHLPNISQVNWLNNQLYVTSRDKISSYQETDMKLNMSINY